MLLLHPLFIATIAYSCGILLYPIFPLLLVSVCLLLCGAYCHESRKLTYILACSFLLFGAVRTTYQDWSYDQFIQKVQYERWTAYGIIEDIEVIKKFNTNAKITLKLERLASEDSHITTNKTIILFCNAPGDIKVGDHYAISPIIIKPPQTATFKNYALKEGSCGTSFSRDAHFTLISRPTISINRTLFNLKANLFNRLKNKLNKKTFTLFSALFLGYKNAFPYAYQSFKERCKQWGIAHYLARSGLHMILFIVIWLLLLRLLPIPIIYKQIILLLLMSIYALLSWSSISFMRALSTALLYKFFTLTNHQVHALHAISLITLLALVFNPIYLYFLDFQLSFGFTLALAYFNYTHRSISSID